LSNIFCEVENGLKKWPAGLPGKDETLEETTPWSCEEGVSKANY
jgi:hypothetical protein